MDIKSKASQVLSEIMQQQLSKDPHLAAKQRRLLEKLNSDTNSPPQSDSTSSAPSEPQPEASASAEPQPRSIDSAMVQRVMSNHPGLTAETARKMLEDWRVLTPTPQLREALSTGGLVGLGSFTPIIGRGRTI